MKSYLIVGLLVAALLVVACGGDQAPPSEEQNTDTTQEETTPESQGMPVPTETNDEPEMVVESTSNAGEKLANALSATAFKVVYKVTGDQAGLAGDLTMTQYIKTSGTTAKTRTDVTVQGIETRSFFSDGVVTSCTNINGWMCREMDVSDTQNPAGDAKEAAKNADEVVADGTKVVAGVTADCYKVTNKDGVVRYCVGDGVPLYVQTTTSAGVNTVEAISYTKSVSDADFVPPESSSGAGAGGLPPGFQMPNY